MAKFDLIVRGGRVIDFAEGIDGVGDVAVKDGRIAQVAPRIAGSHIYQHVTGDRAPGPPLAGGERDAYRTK